MAKKPTSKKKYYYKLTKEIKDVKDVWDRWPVRSQVYRYIQMLEKEKDIMADVYASEKTEDFQTRFFFESEKERESFIREMLVDLKFKVLFFLHIHIERGDKDAVMFALKELMQKDFIQDEIEKIDDGTLKDLKNFFEKKTGTGF